MTDLKNIARSKTVCDIIYCSKELAGLSYVLLIRFAKSSTFADNIMML